MSAEFKGSEKLWDYSKKKSLILRNLMCFSSFNNIYEPVVFSTQMPSLYQPFKDE
jgi:hypothetical protein